MTFLMLMVLGSNCTVYLKTSVSFDHTLFPYLYEITSYRLNDCRQLKLSKCMQGPMTPTHVTTFK